MKLSQKLLALGGVTLADYACCPYDDYGMPHAACTNVLPEKTPFSMQEDWRNGACKAWEANVDATFDGNDNECGTNENWGSCGFQRHFPWNQIDTEDFRNRNCEIEYDSVDQNGPATRTLSDGCHCQGLGDASGAVVCKTNRLLVITNAASTTCTVYDPANNNSDIADWSNICCNPSLTAGTTHTQLTVGDPNLIDDVDVSCPANAIVTDCGDDDVQELIDQNKPKCYESDFLGRRNIQGQNLYIKDADEYTSDMFDNVSPMSFSYDSTAAGSTGGVYNSKLYNLAGVPFLCCTWGVII